MSKEFDTGEQYGFMVQKDNANAAALLAVINDVQDVEGRRQL